MTERWTRLGLQLGWMAGAMFALALTLAASGTAGYEHAHHGIALLGADGSNLAAAFNLGGFALPGIALAFFAVALDRSLAACGSGLPGRLACNLLFLSGAAFAAQSLLPFDPRDVDGPASRHHVLALTLALLAWLPSVMLLAAGLRRRAALRPLAQAGVAMGAAMLVLLAFPAGDWMPALRGAPGHAQRLLLLVYFLWPACLALVLLRRAEPSTQQSRNP